jgi:transcriptional regulator with XRE-family HTH domain
MSIAERLIHIQQKEGLSASKFADLLGIQRSGLSHIYSGRNKPSIDFLQKLSSHFPKYRLEWILNGIEPITNTLKNPQISTQGDLFIDKSSGIVKNEEAAPYGLENDTEISDKDIDIQDDNSSIENSKTIREVLYIYRDGTFEILRPLNNK